MKKSFPFLLACLLLFLACSDNDEKLLVLSQTSCTLDNVNSYAIIYINKGAGEYQITSSKEDVARGIVDGNKIYIWAFSQGETIITVFDQNDNIAKIEVEVVLDGLIIRPNPISEKISLKKGDLKKIKGPDNVDFQEFAIDDIDGIISVYEKNGDLVIEGNKIGEDASIFFLRDMWPVHIYSIDVVDKYYLTVQERNLYLHKNTEFEVCIVTGNGNYVVRSSDETIASAYIDEYIGENSDFFSNPAIIRINTIEVGIATITLIDGEGEMKDIYIHVSEY